MMPAVIVAVLALIALAYVIAPLKRSEPTEVVDPRAELEEKKATALNAILDLETERDVGKLTQSDFDELRAVYEVEALDALHELDGIDPRDGSDPLEREIAVIKDRLRGSSDA
jgi:hypothetical protein